jgi:hypothetical protein
VRDPNTEICDPNRHILLIDAVLPAEKKSSSEDVQLHRLKLRVETVDPINAIFRTLTNAEGRATERIDKDEPSEDSLIHDVQFEDPMPSIPCTE